MTATETCHIVRVGEDGDEHMLDKLGLDLWVATESAESIFEREGIRISGIEEVVFAAVCNGVVVGAATLGSSPHPADEGGDAREYTFSVAVDAKWQKRQLGRKLVEAVLSEAKSLEVPGEYRVWVVNPNMARLLESMGFETEGREWSEDSPHMTRGLARGSRMVRMTKRPARGRSSGIDYAALLKKHGLPAPPHAPLEARWVARNDDWWIRTAKGWFWYDARKKAWLASANGP